MGASKCTQCCERGIAEKIPCHATIAASGIAPPGWPQPQPVHCERITGLSYTPPPDKSDEDEIRELLGAHLPQKPEVLATALPRLRCPPSSGQSSRSYGRPGEPVNKVYVQFSNDLEGFLPYTLVISDETGLEFRAISGHPDFKIDPLNVLKASRIDYDTLMGDAFFASLSKSISGRTVQAADAAAGGVVQVNAEERVRPPYEAMVQLSIRRTVLEGSQVLVFIAVQSDRLATELVRSCEQLRRRRAILYYGECHTYHSATMATARSRNSPSRGCPSPRTVASNSQAALASEPNSPPGSPCAKGAPPEGDTASSVSPASPSSVVPNLGDLSPDSSGTTGRNSHKGELR